MTRTELIALGKRIIEAECDEAELDKLMAQFDCNVPYPEGRNARTGGLTGYAPTADICLSYRIISE